MPSTEADELWDSTAPFENQERPAPKTKKSRKKNLGTEAEIDLPEPDETFAPVPQEPGEIIDGSEDDISALEEQDPTAPIEVAVDLEDRDRVVAPAAAQKKRQKKMAEKTKAEAIRDEITRRKTQGEENIRPRDIIAALEAQGVKVTAPQVSVTLRDFNKPAGAKSAKANKPATAAKNAEKSSKRSAAKVSAISEKNTRAASEPSYTALEAAASFVKTHGGLEQAKNLLDAYAKLFNPAG